MKNGYDQFFKQAKRNRPEPSKVAMPKAEPSNPSARTAAVPQSSRRRRRKNELPLKALGVLFAGLAIATAGLFYVDELDRALSGYEIGVSGAVAAEPVNEEKTAVTPQNAEKLSHPDAKAENAGQTFGGDADEKDMSYLSKLQERKKELDRREKDLVEVEKELQEQRKVLDEKIAELSRIRGEISKILKDRIEMDSEKVNKLVEFYSNMKPQQAAQVFAEINEDLAVEVLGRMKKSNAAAIMNLLKADKAQALSEKFAGYRQPEN